LGTKKLIVVLGPTAVGKTALAVQLAQHFHTEIISADSRQFFSELKIGVARPSDEELQAAPHHFVGFLPITSHYTAGAFERDALKLIDQLFEKNDHVICAGGSGLYIKALLEGLDDLPSDENIKARLKVEWNKEGIGSLQNKLAQLDPEYHAQVDQENPHRLIRAIEVCEITGEKFSALRKGRSNERNFRTIKIGLTADRQWLYNRINQRVELMMKDGLLDEVKSVFEHRHLNALNTVGYKELFDSIEGKTSLDEAVKLIQQHTRNFAKRQMTWWKREEDIRWVNAEGEGLLGEVMRLLELD
jgi:tRNA dimethylallyltransferase